MFMLTKKSASMEINRLRSKFTQNFNNYSGIDRIRLYAYGALRVFRKLCGNIG